MEHLDDSWRPDRSNILIRLHDEDGGLILQPLGKASELLTSEKVLSVIGGCVEAGVAVYISIRTKPGKCDALVYLNQNFAHAVASRVFEAVKLAMLKALECGYQAETDSIAPLEDTT